MRAEAMAMSPIRSTPLKPQNLLLITQIIHEPLSLFSIFQRLFCSHQSPNPQAKPTKPLDLVFKEAAGLIPNPQDPDAETESDPLQKTMKHLEQEIEALKQNPNESQNSKAKLGSYHSYAMFNSKAVHGKMGNEVKIERLWPEMEVLVRYLYEQGYFAKANFVSWYKGRLDFSYFDNTHGRDCIKIAVDKFAKDNQKIVKWLSVSDVEKVALFGCPSTERKSVFGAKRLRKCFDIPEKTVCEKCALRELCRFVNKDWKGSTKCSSLIFVENLDLADVMNTITFYALDSVPSQLIVPDEVKCYVSRLLKQILKLSQTIT